MRMLRLFLPVVAALLAGTHPAAAEELLPPNKPVEVAVDHYIDAALQQDGVKPAPQADDANLLRRLMLDLVGRIPTAAETRAYVESPDPDKRVQLVDRLLASPGFVRHQATEFDTMLMNGTRGSVREYLLKALQDNRPWDCVYREVMLPDEKDPKQQGAGEFLRQRVRDLDKLTAEVSIVFFGVNVSCAQCHDHPLVPDWKQDHFYGMKSFFNRTFLAGRSLAEREFGVVKFKTTKGVERQAKMMFLTGKVVDDPGAREAPAAAQKKATRQKGDGRKKAEPPPPPRVSARAQLVEVSLQPDQRGFFARSIVNRLWHRYFGYGLVMPLDQMHSENPPSHPELLDWLARDLVGHHYDLRRLTRGLVLSRAYARSSLWEGADVPKPHQFAVARVRPLKPGQLATSLRLATTDPASLPATLKPEEFEKRIESLENSARSLAGLFDQPGDDFQVGVNEALLFSNGDRIRKELLADGGDRLVGRLKLIKDVNQMIDVAVRNVYCRAPRPEEVQLLSEYLRRRQDRPVEACRQLVWALLTSSEFRFNY